MEVFTIKRGFFVFSFISLLYPQFIRYDFNKAFIHSADIWIYLTCFCLFSSLVVLWLTSKKREIVVTFTLKDSLVVFFLLIQSVCDFFLNEYVNEYRIIQNFCLLSVYLACKAVAFFYTKREIIFLMSMTILFFVIFLLFSSLIQFLLSTNWVVFRNFYGGFKNSGPYSIYMGSLLMFVGWFCYKSWNERRICLAIISLVCVLFLIFTIYDLNSRSTYLGLLLATSFLVLERFKKFSYVFAFLLFLPVCVYFLYMLRPDSADGRVVIWKSTYRMIEEAPFRGHGIGSFSSRLIDYQGDYLQLEGSDEEKKLAGESVYAFNDFLQIASERGIMGLVVFVSIIVLTFVCNFEDKKVRVILASIVLILVAGITSYPLSCLPTEVFFWAVLGFLSSFSSHGINLRIKHTVALYLGVTVAILYFSIYINIYKSYFKWYTHTANISVVRSLYPSLKYDDYYLYSLSTFYKERKEFETASILLNKAIRLRFVKDYYYELAYCLEQLYDYQAAKKLYCTLEGGVPGLIKPKYHLALLYLNEKDTIAFKAKANEIIHFQQKVKNSYGEALKDKIKFILDRI